MWRWILLSLGLTLSGCYSTIEIVKVREIKKGPVTSVNLDDFLKQTFTDEAYKIIKDIEVVDGPAYFGYAKGTTTLSSIWGIITGTGFGNKVVLDIEDFPAGNQYDDISPGEAIVHEMVHHLHVIGGFIDEQEFEAAYARCYHNSQYKGIVFYVENRANLLFTRVFGIGGIAEHIGYTSEVIAFQDCPKDLGYAYRKILRKYERTTLDR